ncbi:hypothetical protein L202_02938 [Cryptococcus amylolentus CBS 6039]|uniref:Uncharacterized protein n=1 Tax=Cryptococcus amylolentus CBS 6039 TaxID=1295533 RepID=A0A1E3HWW0_9TREE|nr:hypothetical protein L202_02938 [Cryptococcus amylolentus CBS 6039]ODN80787.1 hypothetical protein L202_02938 [Cryptococcus amylolentus CBS 6039]
MSSNTQSFDLRAEEDAARRLNVGRVLPTAGSASTSRAKVSEIVGRAFLRQKADAISKNHGVKFDDDATLYLTSAIESSLQSLLELTRTAQIHRTSSSHLHPPPLSEPPSKSAPPSAPPKPLWSHSLTSHPAAVLDALNRQNRDAEQEFRKQRMDRLARDAELQKARERRERAEAYARDNGLATPSGVDGNVAGSGDGSPAQGSGSLPSTPAPGTPTASGTKKKPSKKSTPSASTPASGSGSSRDLSAEVQHKMTNLTAMRSAGVGKKYNWMMGNAPSVSSPLAGKKRKAEGAAGGAEKGKGKSKLGMTGGAAEVDKDEEEGRKAKKPRGIPIPVRRMVNVLAPPPTPGQSHNPYSSTPLQSQQASGQGAGSSRQVEGDKALTLTDLVFALEHGGLGAAGGQGWGSTTGAALQGVWARGGP